MHNYNPSYGNIVRRITAQGHTQANLHDPIWNNYCRGVAQVVAHLLSKQEAKLKQTKTQTGPCTLSEKVSENPPGF
jgi:hypothetical protein